MKLYYIPASCSLSPHIVMNELGLDATLVKVDHKKHLTESGADYFEVNSFGYAPGVRIVVASPIFPKKAYRGRKETGRAVLFT